MHVELKTLYTANDQVRYTPNDQVRSFARTIDVIAAVGVTCVGKDTLMRESGLYVVKGQASRDQRPSEQFGPTYEFLDTTEKLEQALDDVVAGNYVQVIQHRDTGELYGTLPKHYVNPTPGTACLMDVTAEEFMRIKEEGLFGSFDGVCITAPVPAWRSRQAIRDAGMTMEERQQREAEAFRSLHTCLERILNNPRPDMQFVLNDVLAEAAEDMRRIARGELLSPERQELARIAGFLMLDSVLEPVS